jgi:hypothetical protein
VVVAAGAPRWVWADVVVVPRAAVLDVDPAAAPPPGTVVRVDGVVAGLAVPPAQRDPAVDLVTTGVGDAFSASVWVSIHATASCSVPLHATPTPSLVALGASRRARCGGDPIHQIGDPLLG